MDYSKYIGINKTNLEIVMEDMKKTVDLTPRPEYPRPDFVREDWMNLNGTWAFAFDDENVGLSEGWQMPGEPLDGQIVVPFAYQTKLSGIGPTDAIHPVIWYKRTFVLPENMREKRILLRFGAVDYACSVYVNGHKAGDHVGGYIPFAFEISGLLEEGENEICLRVEDEPDVTQPRGKQYWQKGLMGCWYTPVSGIWQTVYLEAVGETWMKSIHITPDIDRREARVEISLNRTPVAACEAKLEVSYEGQPVQTLCVSLRERITTIPVNMNVRVSPELDGMLTWSPSNPCLYDLKVTLTEGTVKEDCVSTYFGMRKVEVKEGRVYLNNCPIYQRLILDQGYWPDSLITPPSDEAIRKDIQLTLDFGYNGARKHQKVEDPRYYYWADKMGLLVWGEVPSAYLFCDEEIRNVADTLQGFIDRDFNHPSIICWVPLNESWGVREIYTDARQQAMGRMLYHMTKAMDGTRLCSANDGWEQTTTDICALHDYADKKEIIDAHFASREEVETHACDWRPCYAQSEQPRGTEAFMVTEYGGIAFTNIGLQGKLENMETWGYHDKVTDEEAFFQRFEGVTKGVQEILYCQGFCYTQLTDVMQEVNGLVTPDRKPKMDVERVRKINTAR